MIHVDVEWINLATGVIIPILVGLVTKKVASSGLKNVLNSLFSAISGALAVMAVGPVAWKPLVISVITTFATSTAVYYKVWKPLGVTDAVQDKTANFGLGTQPEEEPLDADHT